jgi:hypothetical protein
MSKIKFVQNKVYNYVKGKSVTEVVAEVLAFGVLMPLAVSGIVFMIVGLLTGEIDTSNANFGIYN